MCGLRWRVRLRRRLLRRRFVGRRLVHVGLVHVGLLRLELERRRRVAGRELAGSGSSSGSAASGPQLARTGQDAGLVALAGLGLLLTGAGLRLRVREAPRRNR